MEMIEVIKSDYERWKKADADWVDATLELAKHLAEARRERSSNEEFSAWLDRDCGLSGKINKDDRIGFIQIGKNLELARIIIEEGKSRSINLIGREIKIRCRTQFDNTATTDQPKLEIVKRCCVKCRENEASTGKTDCASCRNEMRKTSRSSSKKKHEPKRLKPIPVAPPDSFLIDLVNGIRQRRKEARDVKGRNKSWTHIGINIVEMRDILDWIEKTLDDKIQELTRAVS